MENFAKEWVEYLFLAMSPNANSIANTQCEWTLTLRRCYHFTLMRDKKQHETQVGMLHFNHMNYVSRATVTCDVQRNDLKLRQITLRHQRHGQPAGGLSDE